MDFTWGWIKSIYILAVWFCNQVFSSSFVFGMGGIPWIIMSEVSSLALGLICTSFNRLTCTIRFTLFQKYNEWLVSIQIFPINIKGPAGSLVTFVCWFGSWLVACTFYFLFEWSSAGDTSLSTLSLSLSLSLSFFSPSLNLHMTVCTFFRNIFHIFEHLRFRCSVHCQTRTRDQGKNIRRNTSIHYLLSAVRYTWHPIRDQIIIRCQKSKEER